MEINELTAIGASGSQETSAGLILKATPPRTQRDLLSRPRLMLGAARFRDVPAMLIQAPAGFGKTSLLAQWRREALGKGSIVPWLTASRADDPRRTPAESDRCISRGSLPADFRPRRTRIGTARPGRGAYGMAR